MISRRCDGNGVIDDVHSLLYRVGLSESNYYTLNPRWSKPANADLVFESMGALDREHDWPEETIIFLVNT